MNALVATSPDPTGIFLETPNLAVPAINFPALTAPANPSFLNLIGMLLGSLEPFPAEAFSAEAASKMAPLLPEGFPEVPDPGLPMAQAAPVAAGQIAEAIIRSMLGENGTEAAIRPSSSKLPRAALPQSEADHVSGILSPQPGASPVAILLPLAGLSFTSAPSLAPDRPAPEQEPTSAAFFQTGFVSTSVVSSTSVLSTRMVAANFFSETLVSTPPFSTEPVPTEFIPAKFVSTERVSTELVSAELVSAELVSAELVSRQLFLAPVGPAPEAAPSLVSPPLRGSERKEIPTLLKLTAPSQRLERSIECFASVFAFSRPVALPVVDQPVRDQRSLLDRSTAPAPAPLPETAASTFTIGPTPAIGTASDPQPIPSAQPKIAFALDLTPVAVMAPEPSSEPDRDIPELQVAPQPLAAPRPVSNFRLTPATEDREPAHPRVLAAGASPDPPSSHTGGSVPAFEMRPQDGPQTRTQHQGPAPARFEAVTERIRTSAPVHTPPPALRPGLAQQISVRIAEPQAPPVDLHVIQRAGQVQVAVRTPDLAFQSSLRRDLGTLVNSLEGAGYHAHAFAPPGTLRQGWAEANFSDDRHPGESDFSGRGSRDSSHEGSHGRPREKRPHHWLEELERQP